MFDRPAQTRLRDRLDYESWLLDFISNTLEMFEGGIDPQKITLTNRQYDQVVETKVHEWAGEGKVMELMTSIMPLMFTAAYKIVDAIFEWVLQENRNLGVIDEVPWKFSAKIATVLRYDSRLTFPPLFQSMPYIKEYLFAIYSKSLKFRNEIVHNHQFSIANDTLHINTVERGEIFTLNLNRLALSGFVRTSVMVANLLTQSCSLGTREDCLLKYYLDQCEKLHALPRFDQKKPILVYVVLKVPEEKGVFPADLKYVRDNVAKIHPDAEVLFDLEVIGLVDNHTSIRWFFKSDSVPEQDLLQLSKDDYEAQRTS